MDDLDSPIAPADAAPVVDGATTATRWIWVSAALLAAAPFLRMANWIRQGTHVQYADYWPIIAQTYNSDGSLDIGGLTSFHAQHLLTLTQVSYVANVSLFGGSNITLGFWVVSLVIVQIGLLWWWLSRLGVLPTVLQAALGVLAASLLLSPNGAWNFLFAMSGTAWLTANLLSILAIHLAVRGRVLMSVLAAVAATLTYGTGLMAWPAIIFVVVWTHRRVRVVAPVVGTALVVVGAYLQRRSATGHQGHGQPAPAQVLENSATVVGGMFTTSVGWATVLGGAALVVLALACSLAVWQKRTDLAFWLALSLYGVGAAGLIGYGRHDGLSGGRDHLLSSRYSSVAALVWICVAVLAATGAVALTRRVRSGGGSPLLTLAAPVMAALVLVVAVVAVAFANTEPVSRAVAAKPRMEELAIAQKVGVAAGRYWFPMVSQPDLSETLPAIGHHPHDGRVNRSCDLLGETLHAEAYPIEGEVSPDPDPSMVRGLRLTGWVEVAHEEVECVLVVDGDGAVVGLGVATERNTTSSRVAAYVDDAKDPLELTARVDGDWYRSPVKAEP